MVSFLTNGGRKGVYFLVKKIVPTCDSNVRTLFLKILALRKKILTLLLSGIVHFKKMLESKHALKFWRWPFFMTLLDICS